MRQTGVNSTRRSIVPGSFYFRCMVVCAVLLAAGPFCAAVPVPIGLDAAGVADFDRAVAAAKMNDALLAVYYVPASVELSNPACPTCRAIAAAEVGAVQSMAAAAASPSVLRVAIRQGEKIPDSLTSAKIRLEGTGVYFLNGDLKLLGHASIDSADDVKRISSAVVQVGDWRRAARHRIEMALKDGGSGHITAALKKLNEVASEDSAISHLAVDGWRNIQAKPTTNPTGPGFFFPDLVTKSTEQMTAQCQKNVDHARQLFETGQLSTDRTMLRLPDGTLAVQRDDLGAVRTLSRDTADLPVVKQARALLARIKPEPAAATANKK